MPEIMTSGVSWDEVPLKHYRTMSAAPGSERTEEPFLHPFLGRLLRIVFAALLAGSAILLAG
jgi:hypothetical protein